MASRMPPVPDTVAIQSSTGIGVKTPGKSKGWRKWKRRLSRVFGGKKTSKGKMVHRVNENSRLEELRVSASLRCVSDDSPTTSEKMEWRGSDQDKRNYDSEEESMGRRYDDSADHSGGPSYDDDHVPESNDGVERNENERSEWEERYDDEEEENIEASTSGDQGYEGLEPVVGARDELEEELLERDDNSACEPAEWDSEGQDGCGEGVLQAIPTEDEDLSDVVTLAATDHAKGDGRIDTMINDGDGGEWVEETEGVEQTEDDCVEVFYQTEEVDTEKEDEQMGAYENGDQQLNDDVPDEEEDNVNEAEIIEYCQEVEKEQASLEASASRESTTDEEAGHERSIVFGSVTEPACGTGSFDQAPATDPTLDCSDISFIRSVAEWCHECAMSSLETQLLTTCIEQEKYELAHLLATRLVRDHHAMETPSSQKACAILDAVLLYCTA